MQERIRYDEIERHWLQQTMGQADDKEPALTIS